MKKGIIMEINDAHLTLLTPEGEFLHSKRMDQIYNIGEEIHFFPIESVFYTKKLHSLKNVFKVKTVWAVMAAILIFLGSFIPINQDNNAYAYMSIDANPSIELGVNKKMQVIELTGFNKEGKKIISELSGWKKINVTEVTQSILTEMKNAGYTKNNEQIIISTVRTNQTEDSVEKELQNNLKEIKATINQQKLKLTVITATKKERDEARELGLSTGKFQEIKKPSSHVGREQDKNSSTSEYEKTIPSGNIKKQSVNNNEQEQGIINNKLDFKPNLKGNSMPYGQLKKIAEEQWKQNQEQLKKSTEEQWKQNQEQLKKSAEEQWKQNQEQLKKSAEEQWKQNQGQLKKSAEERWKQSQEQDKNFATEQWKQNQGQNKKQYQQQENTNKFNNGYQRQKEKNSNAQNKWKQNNSNQQNQSNQNNKHNDHKNR